MFTVIYKMKVKQGCDKDFIRGWKSLTKFIYEYEGSLGSRLHKLEEGHYLAYAQWPSKEVFSNAGDNLPEIAHESRKLMKDSCEKITTGYEMQVVTDLFEKKPFQL
ncbi:MAG: heme-degrading monooxygenase HmoA [Salibacteraceae bacterium]|jgi:heme-degrading monooxygenase HmoA